MSSGVLQLPIVMLSGERDSRSGDRSQSKHPLASAGRAPGGEGRYVRLIVTAGMLRPRSDESLHGSSQLRSA